MKFYEDFLKSIFPTITLSHEKESDKFYEGTFVANAYDESWRPEKDGILSFLQTRDSLHLSIQFGVDDPIVFKSISSTLSDLKKELDEESKYLDKEQINITLTISKIFIDSRCTIYDLEVFTVWLQMLNAYDFINIFSELFKSSMTIDFEVYGLKESSFTNSISFIGSQSSALHTTVLNKNEIIESFKSVSHFSDGDRLCVLPKDFVFIVENSSLPTLNEIFKKYSAVLSVLYLFDITELVGNMLSFKLNGYKSIKGTIDLGQTCINEIEPYLEIFNWVYNGGNLNDKIGLARNIISLNFLKNGELTLVGNPFQAIQSSYKVYERQNIKQYIEIRNKVSDQLLDFNNRANKLIEVFASGFQKSSLALISFYTSAIAIRLLAKGDFTSVFSLDMTTLSLCFLLGAFIYYWVSRWEIAEQRKRFVSSYENLKSRYTDLLNQDDINRILGNDKEFSEDLAFIDNKKYYYSVLWISVLMLIGLATIFLFMVYNMSQFFDTFIFRAIFGSSCNCN